MRLVKVTAENRRMGREKVNVETFSRLNAIVHGGTLDIRMTEDNSNIRTASS